LGVPRSTGTVLLGRGAPGGIPRPGDPRNVCVTRLARANDEVSSRALARTGTERGLRKGQGSTAACGSALNAAGRREPAQNPRKGEIMRRSRRSFVVSGLKLAGASLAATLIPTTGAVGAAGAAPPGATRATRAAMAGSWLTWCTATFGQFVRWLGWLGTAIRIVRKTIDAPRQYAHMQAECRDRNGRVRRYSCYIRGWTWWVVAE
jgi:hypothetical protein